MTVAQLFTDIRYQMSDELKSGYSDTELIGYLNQTNEAVYATLLNAESNQVLKKTTITLTSGVGSLPSDFIYEDAVKSTTDTDITGDTFRHTPNKMESVPSYQTVGSNTYTIIGDDIYSDNDSLDLFYYYIPDGYSAITDNLTIPSYFKNLYIQMIKFLAQNTDEFDTSVEQALMNRFESNIMNISGKRGASNPRAVMPFRT